MQVSHKIILPFIFLFFFSCHAKQDGVLEGTVAPPNIGAKIMAMRAGNLVSSTDVTTQDGKFKMALAPGQYDISVTSPSAPFPMSFPGILIESGKTTTLPLVAFTPSASTAVLSGVVSPGSSETKVSLLYEGKERAAIPAGPEGKYEFMGLPAGKYTVQANSPGYAGDAVEINISSDQKTAQNIRLLYISSLDGVDWTAGKIRAKGKGVPPPKTSNPTIMHEMAKRAALVDAQRNLLKILEQVQVDSTRNIKSFLGEKKYRDKIQGFVQGYRVVGERDLGDGAVEVELELPLTGPSGLSRYITE